MSRSCVVVGAGPAGLSAAYRLANAGLRVTVLESADVLGGRTRTERVGDFIINTGAGFVANFYDATLSILRDLHLEPIAARPQQGIVATPFGKLPFDPSSPRSILGFPLISWTGKIRALAVFARAAFRRGSHIAKTASLARLDRGGSVERWGLRTFGESGYHYLLRSGIEPFFFFGAEEASAALARVLIRHALKWRMLVLSEGTGALCDALARRLEVRTGCHANGVEVDDSSVTVHHSGGAVKADYAILAVPASAIARLEGSVPDQDRVDISAVRYAPNIALFFGYERPITVQHPLVIPAGPGRHPIVGVRKISQWVRQYVPEGKELISIHASAWRSAELLERDPGKIVAEMRSDAEDIFGRLADPDWIRMYPREEAIVLPQPSHYRRMQALLRRPRERLLYAGDWLTGSTIEGAVRTGLDAAERILQAG